MLKFGDSNLRCGGEEGGVWVQYSLTRTIVGGRDYTVVAVHASTESAHTTLLQPACHILNLSPRPQKDLERVLLLRTRIALVIATKMSLYSEASCRKYVATETPSAIASQIRHDQASCNAQRLPSILARYLPPVGSELADKIAVDLCPETAIYGRAITRAQYAGIVQGIKLYLDEMTHKSRLEELPTAKLEEYNPSNEDIDTTLKVLDFCLKSKSANGINLRTPLEDILLALSTKFRGTSSSNEKEQSESIPKSQWKIKTKCYICQFVLVTHHPQYHSLCNQCGDFNLASCSLSLPESLKLQGRTALVTGGRLNLGYHTALRLLRCGANVIVSTRYPQDAECHYLAEKDFSLWQSQLRIVGADFRAATDVFHLVSVVRDQLVKWSEDGVAKLDILVNNAAQTLTDPLQKERRAVSREVRLRIGQGDSTSILQLGSSGYQARIRGGVQSSRLLAFESGQQEINEPKSNTDATQSSEADLLDSHPEMLLTTPYDESKSSWMQSIHQIPYEDVISAHSVNTFVPLILIRELLPLMGSLRSPSISSSKPPIKKPTRPLAYIVNVSSREGIFEATPNSSPKHGHHVHTNLTKAALNMLTETEAAPAWKERQVAINSVDPGYMSAAPEIVEKWRQQGREACPIGWEDGAGRVLWPIAVGESGDGPVWGRFLKHFGSVEVSVGLGR